MIRFWLDAQMMLVLVVKTLKRRQT